jgi:hypothetical protein
MLNLHRTVGFRSVRRRAIRFLFLMTPQASKTAQTRKVFCTGYVTRMARKASHARRKSASQSL